MKDNRLWILAILIIATLLTACGQGSVAVEKIEPAIVEAVEGSEFNLVKLTDRAAERLDIQTVPVREELIGDTQRLVVPYASLLYGLHGETWVYINEESLTFTRTPIDVDYIDGDTVVLVDGPPVGTQVVTVGVAELFGADTGVGK